MEKKVLVFLVITIVFMMVYTHFIPKMVPQQPSPASSVVSTPEDKQEKSEDSADFFEEETGQIEEAVLDEFYVTFSLTGGYIRNIFIKKYQEKLCFENIGLIKEHKDYTFKLVQEGEKIILINSERKIRKEFIFEGYLLTLKVVTPEKNYKMIIVSNSLIKKGLEQRYQEFFYKSKYSGPAFKRHPFKKTKPGFIKADILGIRDRYFCFALFDDEYEVKLGREKPDTLWIESECSFASPPLTIFIGPQIPEELKKYGLEGVINYGFFHSIGTVMIKLLYFFNAFTKNWGLSIMLISILIYLILFPFTAKSTKAMRRMQALQPKMEELKTKYKDAPQKLNKEILQLYRTHKVNPLGGCLPIFFQLPVFFALYQVLFRFVELKGASFLWIKDLSSPDQAFALPFSIPFLGNYLNILPIIIMVLGILQQKFTSQSAASQQQKTMGLFMGVFIGFIFYNFPSALVLYWLIQNSATLLYQWRISKTSLA